MSIFKPEERHVIRSIAGQEYERRSRLDRKVARALKAHEDEKDTTETEVIADELLSWIARRKYSRYIVFGWSFGLIYLGHLLAQYRIIFQIRELFP